MQSTEAPVCNLYGKARESLDHDSNSTIGFMTRPLTDCRDEESGFEHSHDNEGSACDSIPLKLETQTEASQENKKIGAGKDLSETDAKGHKGAKFDAGEVSEMVSKFQKMEDVTSEPAPTAEFLKLKEGHADVLASGISLNDLSPEVKSDEPVDSSVDAAQTKGVMIKKWTLLIMSIQQSAMITREKGMKMYTCL
ncbi:PENTATRICOPEPTIDE REPEAT (PPR) SUPERFAMILY PROTEIN [Salix koriyanagi]|uniref:PENTATRICOPEPTIDE REPEAT (PPR) SUPERFAMILY PROTEIN n=1 Tax=Salix koriyanagi TaxID=2511006 RepID=A0A9Q0TFT4_9ROSI|nr:PENTATRICOPEPTIDE REPEAT (PPR) SUPERFAMILY PROTEIN [Salix koriyanagi]